MKKTLLLLALLTSSILGFNQTNGKTFHLKNGSIITGAVLEEVPGKSYKVKTTEGNIFVFKANEIEKITLNTSEAKKTEKKEVKKGVRFYNDNALAFSMITQASDETAPALVLSTMFGVKINEQICLSLGFELMHLDVSADLLPIFLDAKYQFKPQTNSAFVLFNVGYVAGAYSYWTGNNNNGIRIQYQPNYLVRAGLGYGVKLTEKLDLNFSINAGFMQSDYAISVFSLGSYERSSEIEGLFGLKIGLGLR